MALSDPRGQFGAHSVCFYNRDSGLPLAYLRVIGECSVNFEAEFADLEGGSQMYPWDSEVSKIGSEIKLTGREYDGATMEILMGGDLTENTAEATGAVEDFANVYGTSIKNDSTGIHNVSVTSGDSGDLKEGKYIIKATGAKAATVYCMSDVDFQHGNDAVFTDDTLAVGTLDFTSGTNKALADFGLTFEIGSGTTAFVTNDTAEFYVRKPNTESIELVFGASGAEFTECGVVIAGQKQADGTISTLELYKCKVAGMPISFNEKSWSEWSCTIKALYDSSKNAIGKFRRTLAA
jgi:hypothetical protein